MKRLTKNCAQCLICGDVIESKHRHDWVQCSCEAIFVDGGTDYRRMGGNPAYLIDMCEYEKTLVPDSLAVSQENLHSVEKSTVPDTLQNESQALEMQGHLPECPYRVDHPTLPRNRGLICICDELRACEQRVLELRLDDLKVKSFNAGLDAAERSVTTLVQTREYVFSDSSKEILHEAVAAIHALKEKP